MNMGWTESQRIRLAVEKKAIDKYFPNFEVKDPLENTYWIGTIVTNKGTQYIVRINIPVQYPEQPPKTYIVSPHPLYTFDGTNLLDIGTSHKMHTFESTNGYVQMCLYRSECWSAEYTLISCLKKARIWLEAYDEHLDTGKEMCDIVGTQEVNI